MGVLVRVAAADVVVPVHVLAFVRVIVAVLGPVGVHVFVCVTLVVMRVLPVVLVPMLVHAAVGMRVDVHMPVRVRVIAFVRVGVRVHRPVRMPVLVGVAPFPFDPGFAFAATTGGAHDSFLCKAGFGIQDSGFRTKPSFPNGEF
jgi:hypothetical protein